MITNETLVETAKDAIRRAQQELADAISMVSHVVSNSAPKGVERSISPAIPMAGGIVSDLGEVMGLLSSISTSLISVQKLAREKDEEDEKDKPYRLCGKEEKKRRLIDCGRWVEGEMEWCLTSYQGDGLEDGEWDWRYFDKRPGGHVYGE